MAPWTIWFKTDDADHWQPLESCRSLPTGHYRLAARLPVPFKRLQWRWKFFAATGKVENHNFQGQTNQEGLISLLDLHTVQPGTWQLSAQPDLFDHLCGETWQIRFQFQIIAPAVPVITVPKPGLEENKEEEHQENNAIVPHPPSLVVPELDPEPMPVLQWSRKTALTKLIREEEIPNSPESPEMLEIAEKIEEVLEVEAQEEVLEIEEIAVPAIAPTSEKSGKFTPFRSVSYSLELIYPELENPIQVDITVMVDENRRPANLNLPDPRRMVSSLYRRSNKSRSPLPPKLTSTVD